MSVFPPTSQPNCRVWAPVPKYRASLDAFPAFPGAGHLKTVSIPGYQSGEDAMYLSHILNVVVREGQVQDELEAPDWMRAKD